MKQNPSIEKQADNLFGFISKVLNDKKFAQEFNQGGAPFLGQHGLDTAQIQALTTIHKIRYNEEITESKKHEQLHHAWHELIDANKEEYIKYLSTNFSW